ncbi:YiiX/YebB-like N1pC/P60 family cysteine hydrolase [Lutibacter sp.]
MFFFGYSTREFINVSKFKKGYTALLQRKWVLFILIFILSIKLNFGQSNKHFSISINHLGTLTGRVDENYKKYLNLLEKHKNIQKKLLDSADYFKKIRKKDYVFSGKDIHMINLSFSNRIKLLNQSLTFSNIDKKDKESARLYNLISTHIKIIVLETYMLQQQVIGQNSKVNNLINEENKLYRQKKKSLKKIKKYIISKKYRESILNAWLASEVLNENDFNKNKNTTIANNIIKTNYYQHFLLNSKSIRDSKRYFRKLINKRSSLNTTVNFNNFVNSILSGLSNFVGNFVGIFAIRKGKLFKNVVFIQSSLKLLQPLDILLEKTPFRLTDKFIPGFWGHAAIYVGNETQLKKLGIWDNPIVLKYREEIRKGKVIVEALRSNVAFNSFKHFTNIDDYAQLRLNKELTIEKKKEMILRVFAQIGKKYDFRYNVESSKKIICSELHYIIFNNVRFNTKRVMGINTILVDQVAEQGLKGGTFYPVNLYLDGIKVKNNRIIEIYNQLLIAKNKEIRKLKKSLH